MIRENGDCTSALLAEGLYPLSPAADCRIIPSSACGAWRRASRKPPAKPSIASAEEGAFVPCAHRGQVRRSLRAKAEERRRENRCVASHGRMDIHAYVSALALAKADAARPRGAGGWHGGRCLPPCEEAEPSPVRRPRVKERPSSAARSPTGDRVRRANASPWWVAWFAALWAATTARLPEG